MSKPDPEGLLLASQLLGIPAESCVVIEDAAAGVKAAVSAGMKSIGIFMDLMHSDFRMALAWQALGGLGPILFT